MYYCALSSEEQSDKELEDTIIHTKRESNRFERSGWRLMRSEATIVEAYILVTNEIRTGLRE